MKKTILFLGIATMVIVSACNNQSSESNKAKEMKHSGMEMDSMQKDTMVMDSTMHHSHPHSDSLNTK